MDENYKSIIGWLDEPEAKLLHDYALMAPIPRVLELGAFCGKSACVFANVMKERGGMVVTMDMFPPNFAYKTAPEKIIIPDTLYAFKANMKRLGLSDYVIVLVGDIMSILPKLSATFGLVYVDAAHTIEGVIQNYSRAWPMLCPGGYMVFHDYGHPDWPGVKLFVDSICIKLGVENIGAGRMAIIRKPEEIK